MNIFKKFYCRTYQTAFRIMLPLLPYREPKLLDNNGEVCAVLREKNIDNILLVTDKGVFDLGLTNSLQEELTKNNVKVTIYSGTVANPTTDNVAEALTLYKENNCQGIISFGGGSAMDCAKAVGARLARPNKTLKQMKGVLKVGKKTPLLIAVPTTAGTGSETTLAAVITDSETRHKYAINDFPLIPDYALLDPYLTVGLPKSLTATTGMDALTHAVEAYIGRSTTKQTRKCALFAVKTIFENILEVYNNGANVEARKNMLVASYNAGLAFTKSYVGYVHAVAHSLGGKYNVAHGLANAIILPHILRKFGKSIHKKLWKMAVYAGICTADTSVEDGAKVFIEKIDSLNKEMNIPTGLDCIQEEDIPQLAQTAAHEGNPLYPVPVIFTAKELEDVYKQIKL
ncbi:MAG: iron-containing alcohol dehydrogenase [Clostridia bacterium]|nr:iron-containing alcohol dehydrogenase [Clostridia bacterium]